MRSPTRLTATIGRAACGLATVLVGAYLFVLPEAVLVVGVDPLIDHNRAAYLERMPVVAGWPLHLVGLIVAVAGILAVASAATRNRQET